jgi:hypothetical protein
VVVHGGSMTVSTMAQLRRSDGGGKGAAPGGGGCSFYSQWRWLAKAVRAAAGVVKLGR